MAGRGPRRPAAARGRLLHPRTRFGRPSHRPPGRDRALIGKPRPEEGPKMNSKHWSRLLPGVVVTALLSLGIGAPPPGPPVPPVPPGSGPFFAPCVDDAIAVTG